MDFPLGYAANATFALNAGLWFRLGRLAIFAPSFRNAAGYPVQFVDMDTHAE